MEIYQKDSITAPEVPHSPSKMALLVPAEDLQMNSSLDEAWPLCKEHFLYLKADDVAQWPSNQNMSLLTVAQPKASQVFNSSHLSPTEKDNLEVVLDHSEGHCRPHYSDIYERFLFHTRFQELHEPFEDFVADLQYKSHLCNFGDQRESLVRDQVILGCRDSLVRQQLLQHNSLGLEEALEICRRGEEKEAQHVEDSCRHPKISPDEEKALFQEGHVKEKRHQASRRKGRRVRNMGKRLNHWQQEVDNCLRKESFKTYV